MELEFKHIKAYPKDLGIMVTYHGPEGDSKSKESIVGFSYIDNMIMLDKAGDYYFDDNNDFSIKLMLRPLSQITEEIEHNGEKISLLDFFLDEKIYVIKEGLPYISYGDMQALFAMHFDVFGLIENNLAIEKK